MASRRVLLLWLDGYDAAVGDALMQEGRLPALRRLRSASARFALDHGPGQRTGLAGEHLSTGVSAEDARRRSPIHFDPKRYAAWQEGTSRPPFPASLRARTVVFDATYFDLARAPAVRGIVHWSARGLGASLGARPDALRGEIDARFGPYPSQWIYGFVWPSPARTRAMGEALASAAEKRAAVARWLLAERLPDWDLAFVASGELHSAAESLWHGVDRTHPLHDCASAAPARAAYYAVYDAVDRMVGQISDAFPDAALVVCNLHGMGSNNADVPSTALLPELLFRWNFCESLLRGRPEWSADPRNAPSAPENATWWPGVAKTAFADIKDLSPALQGRARPAANEGRPAWPDDGRAVARAPVESMCASWYSRFWPAMRAFALPSYSDGRIRINLAGREASARVPRWAYGLALRKIERLVEGCRDLRTGEPVVASIEQPARRDPLALDPTSADLIVDWRGSPVGFAHPRYGRIGPLPYQRPGGHSGGHGIAYLAGAGLAPGHYGLRSAYDVVPTVIDLLGEPRPAGISGASLVRAAGPPPARMDQ